MIGSYKKYFPAALFTLKYFALTVNVKVIIGFDLCIL